jgi:hypothetical protein
MVSANRPKTRKVAAMSIAKNEKTCKSIETIGITKEVITSRAGLAPLAEFVKKCGAVEALANLNPVKKSGKGASDSDSYLQLLLYFIDGTNLSLTGFDALSKDSSWADCCGIPREHVLSSHAVKRFIGVMPKKAARTIRRLLLSIFRQSLKIQKPEKIVLDIDTVVYDNDTALKREGCSPTYKKVKGFQPLMVKWGQLVVWSEFREGKVHSNHGTTVQHALTVLTTLIHSVLGKETPILVTFDSGFFDQKIFKYLEQNNLFYICSGKMYKDIPSLVGSIDGSTFKTFNSANPDGVWEYADINDRRASWDTARRAIYTRRTRTRDGQQELLGLEAIYYTNLEWAAETIIATAHARGEAELVHRKLKDFAGELLPFQSFAKNEVWFFLMLVAFNLFETYKSACDTILETAHMYPTTFRRRFIDIAGKIVRHAGKIILKTTSGFYDQLSALWSIQQDFNYQRM